MEAHERAVERIDGGDLSCARLLILLRARVAELDAESVVHLSTTDPVAPIDLPAWCRITGHTYLGVADAGPPPVYAVRVSGSPVATRPDRPWHPA
ncbi:MULTISPECIES: sulfurtransferase TusA family protein [Janibacter]|uniref:sulfurtransferase TusA family protein n=1 Tax=Janibacter TaxID=53457 RepID=UPI00082DBFF4|nr:sulfurtransferase TusA family protein [Janibacter terrae]